MGYKPTNGRTDERTNGRTDPLLELLVGAKNSRSYTLFHTRGGGGVLPDFNFFPEKYMFVSKKIAKMISMV